MITDLGLKLIENHDLLQYVNKTDIKYIYSNGLLTGFEVCS